MTVREEEGVCPLGRILIVLSGLLGYGAVLGFLIWATMTILTRIGTAVLTGGGG